MAMQFRTDKPTRRTRERRRMRSEIVKDATVRRILDLMIDRAMTMTQAANTVGVNHVTAWRRLQEPQFLGAYECARVLAADELVTQAEASLNPPEGGACLSPQQVKLRIAQARQKLWRAARISPALGLQSQHIYHP